MTVDVLMSILELKAFTDVNSREVTGVYCCDLLSNALTKLKSGNIWLTVVNNSNVAAVAKVKDITAVVLTEGIVPGNELLDVSKAHGICLLGSELPVYELSAEIDHVMDR